MYDLPEPKPTAPAAGQATNPLTDAVVQAAVDHAIEKARRLGTTPAVVIGNTPAVTDQPGARRPAMSQRAVDLNTTILTSSVLVTALGGAVAGSFWASGHANPTVIGWVCACVVAAPAALAVPVLAVKGLMKSAKEVAQAAPPETNNYFNGPTRIHQDQRTDRTRNVGVWVRDQHQQ